MIINKQPITNHRQLIVGRRSSVVSSQSGQSLIELIVGLSVGVIFIGGATLVIAFALNAKNINKKSSAATTLVQETLDKVRAVGNADWSAIYNLNRSPSNYHIAPSGTALVALGNATGTVIDNIAYTIFFTVDDVNRNASGDIVTAGGALDTSTIKINSQVRWLAGATSTEIELSDYLTRSQNKVFDDKNWFGGAVPDAVVIGPNGTFSASYNAYVTASGSVKIIGY